MQYVAEDNSDKIGLCAVPWLDVVSVSAMEILLVSDGEVDLTSCASGQQEQGCKVTWSSRFHQICIRPIIKKICTLEKMRVKKTESSHLQWVFASRWSGE